MSTNYQTSGISNAASSMSDFASAVARASQPNRPAGSLNLESTVVGLVSAHAAFDLSVGATRRSDEALAALIRML